MREVVLTRIAELQLKDIINYLEISFSEDIKSNFLLKLSEFIEVIRKNPEAFPKSKLKAGTHKCVLSKQT